MIPLNVGGYSFVTTLSTLTKDKDSMLAAMFSGRHELDTDSEGRFFIDRDGTYFKYILNYLRDRKQLPSAELALEVRTTSEFNDGYVKLPVSPSPYASKFSWGWGAHGVVAYENFGKRSCSLKVG